MKTSTKKNSKKINRPLSIIPADFYLDPVVQEIISLAKPYPQQFEAVIETLRKISKGKSLVYLIMAMTQSGKSTTSVILARILNYYLTKTEQPVTHYAKTKHFTIIYLVALPLNDLEEQAKQLFDVKTHHLDAGITTGKLLNIEKLINEIDKLKIQPGCIFVDESHLSNDAKSVNFPKLMRELKGKWKNTFLILISATPHSFLSVRDNDGRIPYLNCDSEIIIQKPGASYRGIVEYYDNGQITELMKNERDITNSSPAREKFLKHIEKSKKCITFVRVQKGKARMAVDLFKHNFPKAQIVLLGRKWKGIDTEEMSSLEELHTLHANLKTASHDKNRKIIVLIRAGLSAGIDLGPSIKSDIAAIWESYRSSLSSVLQGVLARSCGYSDNFGIMAFCHFPELGDYIYAIKKLYECNDIKPMQDYLNKIIPNSFIKLDSEGKRGKKIEQKKQVFHDIEYITTLYISNDLDVRKIMRKAVTELNDSRLTNVIQSALGKYISVEKIDNEFSNAYKDVNENYAIRYVGHNYCFGPKHNYMNRIKAMNENSFSCYERSFERFARLGSRRSDRDREYAVLVCAADMKKSRPLSSTQIREIRDSLIEIGPHYRNESDNESSNLLMIIVKRGTRAVCENSTIAVQPSNIYEYAV